MTRTLLVTGFRGQIGSRLVSRLLQSHPEFSLLGIDLPGGAGADPIQACDCDLSSAAQISAIAEKIKDAKILVHLATRVTNTRDFLADGMDSIDQNIQSTLNLVSALPRLEKIVFASSYMVYGAARPEPIKENAATDPINLYGAGKLATEKFLAIYGAAKNIPVTSLRMAGVYGKEHRAISSFITAAAAGVAPPLWGEVQARRNYLHMDDCVAALLTAAAARTGGVYNVAGGDAVSVLDILSLLESEFGKDLKLPPRDSARTSQSDFVLDCTKFHTEQGFQPGVSFLEGLRRQIREMQSGGTAS